LRFRLPAGYEFDDVGRIIRASDEQVAHFVKLVFAKVFEFASVSGVTQYLLHEGLRFPRREVNGRSIRWEVPYYRAVYLMLTNPIYAGTYAFGRSKAVCDVDAQGNRRTRRQMRPMAEWDVVLHDHHPAYVSREDFERIQRMIERNRPAARDEASTALREGSALLQGILRCGRCGRAMTVRYNGRSGRGWDVYYMCAAAHAQKRAPHCQAMGGRRIEEAVSRVFLEAMSEGHLDIQVAALRKLDEHDDAVLRQLELQQERARYEAGRLERQYNSVEPENRVVARTLETRWNEALHQVEQIEQQLSERRRQLAVPLTDDEQRQLRDLAQDLPKLWAHRRVTNKDRKALLRAAIEEVQIRKEDRIANIKIIWKGQAVTETPVALLRLPPRSAAPPDLIALVGELAKRYSDAQIARILVRRGVRTPRKKLPFTAHHVTDLRLHHGIPRCPEPSPNDSGSTTYTVEQTAKLFGVSPPTIYAWLKLGILVGEQLTAGAPWSIQVTDDDRRRLGTSAPVGWLSLNDAVSELGLSKQTILNWVKAGKVSYVYATHGQRRGLRIDVKSAPLRKQAQLLD